MLTPKETILKGYVNVCVNIVKENIYRLISDFVKKIIIQHHNFPYAYGNLHYRKTEDL